MMHDAGCMMHVSRMDIVDKNRCLPNWLYPCVLSSGSKTSRGDGCCMLYPQHLVYTIGYMYYYICRIRFLASRSGNNWYCIIAHSYKCQDIITTGHQTKREITDLYTRRDILFKSSCIYAFSPPFYFHAPAREPNISTTHHHQTRQCRRSQQLP
jgi:hypothetical protein